MISKRNRDWKGMGTILDTPVTEKEVYIINGNAFHGAVVSMQGWRTSMEVGFLLRESHA